MGFGMGAGSISRHWPGPEPGDIAGLTVSSVVVQARVQEHEHLEERSAALAGASVHARSPAGKMVVVIETRNDAELVRRIDEIGALPGVLGVNLVFHHSEAARDAGRLDRSARRESAPC